MADHTYQVSQTQQAEIDPRLQAVASTSQSYSSALVVSGPSSHFRPAPPSPFHQQHQQHQHQQHPHLRHQQQQYDPPQPWPQDGFNYYTPQSQHLPSTPHVQQHPAQPFQPHQGPSGALLPTVMQTMQAESHDPKRTRACEACRNLKVKCEPNQEGGRCKRCLKAGRNCVTSAPSRKRLKKTDSKVADLEKRIDDLQRQMQSAKDGNVSESDDGNDVSHGTPNVHSTGGISAQQSPYTPVPQGPTLKRRFAEINEEGCSEKPPPSNHVEQTQLPARTAAIAIPEGHTNPLQRSIIHDDQGSSVGTTQYGQVDVIGRGLLSPITANELFVRYTKQMAPHMPVVTFPEGTIAENVRKASPILFLAILSVASGENYQDLQIALNKEIMHTLAGRIIVSGEKSLELIQALQVVTIWYWREANGDSKYYQFVHLAATMAIDLRLNRKAEVKRQPVFELQQPKSFISDSESTECRRAWLGCYLLASSIAMGTRRQTLIRHTDNSKYFDECLTRLRQSEDTMDVNHKLCDLVQLQTFADDLALQILPDDNVVISEATVCSAHQGFEMKMKDWQDRRRSIEESVSISFAYNVINLYMYELAMQHVSRFWDKPHPSQTQQGSNTALTSTLGILDAFSRFSVQEILTLPIFHFAQIAHASVSLIKMYFVAKDDSDYYQHIPITITVVQEHLSRLVNSLRTSAADGKSLGAHTFLKVINNLQILFENNKQTSIASIKARYGKIPSLKGIQILELEEPEPTPQQRTASRQQAEKSGDALHLLHLASAAAMEQSNASGAKSETDSTGRTAPDNGEVAAMGQLIGEGDMGFMSDVGFLGIMQTMFLKGMK